MRDTKSHRQADEHTGLKGHQGAAFRVSLTYQNPEHSPGGETPEDTDTFHGRFSARIQ
jgi:hypothetical protein